MKYRLYGTSESAWKGMIEAISNAKTSIYFEMYIFDNDSAGQDFIKALQKKAEEKVKVVLILDIVGSFNLKTDWVTNLKNAGGEVIFFSHFFQRAHRKILIIDEMVAFVGGVNVGNRFANWNDLVIRFEGASVNFVTHSFAKMYKKSGGINEEILSKSKPRLFGRTKLWFIDHGFSSKRRALRDLYSKHISEAKSKIIFVTPYLVPPRWLIAHIHLAILRGVEVEFLVPKKTDVYIANRVNYYYLNIFYNLGARILIQNSMNHSKAMLIDKNVGIIGSQNLDKLSFDWNMEGGVFFSEPEIINDLEKLIESWKDNSSPFDREYYHSNWFDKFLSITFTFISRVL